MRRIVRMLAAPGALVLGMGLAASSPEAKAQLAVNGFVSTPYGFIGGGYGGLPPPPALVSPVPYAAYRPYPPLVVGGPIIAPYGYARPYGYYPGFARGYPPMRHGHRRW
jgi:hypothetical protein